MVKTSWTHLKYAVGDCINMNYLVSDSGWKLNWNSWIYKNSTTNCYIHFTPSVSDFLWLIKLFLSPATCRFGHWKSVSLWHSSVTDWLEALLKCHRLTGSPSRRTTCQYVSCDTYGVPPVSLWHLWSASCQY